MLLLLLLQQQYEQQEQQQQQRQRRFPTYTRVAPAPTHAHLLPAVRRRDRHQHAPPRVFFGRPRDEKRVVVVTTFLEVGRLGLPEQQLLRIFPPAVQRSLRGTFGGADEEGVRGSGDRARGEGVLRTWCVVEYSMSCRGCIGTMDVPLRRNLLCGLRARRCIFPPPPPLSFLDTLLTTLPTCPPCSVLLRVVTSRFFAPETRVAAKTWVVCTPGRERGYCDSNGEGVHFFALLPPLIIPVDLSTANALHLSR